MATLRRRKANVALNMEEAARNPVVGSYILGDLLESGSSTAIYRGINTENGEIVAMKQIDRNKLPGEELENHLKEITRLKALDHRNIVKLLDTYRGPRYIYTIMEYVESGSLAQIIENFDVFPETLTALYMYQCLRGLVYLHENNVPHGSIKGSNILITKNGQVKLYDYGLTKQSKDDVPFWSSPDVIKGAKPTMADDVWSLGCTAIELFTGAPPYQHLGPVAATLRIIQDPAPPLPEGIGADFTDFLSKCFIKDMSRPSAADLQRHPWVRKAQPPQEEQEQSATILELRKFSRSRGRGTGGMLMATEEEEDKDNEADLGVMLRVTMQIDGKAVDKTFHANVKATAKVLVSVALNKFGINDDANLYSLCEVHQESQEERIYDDDDLPVDGREQWELIEDEVGWAVKKKAPLVKEGYLRRKSRLRFGKWKTLYAVLDKEHRYYAYYKKKPAHRESEMCTDVIYSLTHIDSVTISSRNPKQFVIVCNEEFHLLESSSAEETLDWVNQIRYASRNDFELGYKEPFLL